MLSACRLSNFCITLQLHSYENSHNKIISVDVDVYKFLFLGVYMCIYSLISYMSVINYFMSRTTPPLKVF